MTPRPAAGEGGGTRRGKEKDGPADRAPMNGMNGSSPPAVQAVNVADVVVRSLQTGSPMPSSSGPSAAPANGPPHPSSKSFRLSPAPSFGTRPPSAGGKRPRRLSIRALVIVSSAVYIVGAMAFSWGITFWMGMRNVQSVGHILMHKVAAEATLKVSEVVDGVTSVVAAARRDFETGALEPGRWRALLESFSRRVGSGAETEALYARFADGSALGAQVCRSCPASSPRVFAHNGSLLSTYAADGRGQPGAILGRSGDAGLAEWHAAVAGSPKGALWRRSAGLPGAPVGGERPGPHLEFAAAFRSLPRVESLASFVPAGLPGAAPAGSAPEALAEPADAPLAGVVGASLALSRLAEAISGLWSTAGAYTASLGLAGAADDVGKGGVVAVIAEDGLVLASSGVANAPPVPPYPAADSGSALLASLPGGFAGSVDGTFQFNAEGGKYMAGSGALQRDGGLAWRVYVAVPEESVMRELNRSLLVVCLSNSLWLVLGLACAALVGLVVTRPLAAIYDSLSDFVQSLSSLTAEMAGRPGVPPAVPPPPAPPSSPPSRDLSSLNLRPAPSPPPARSAEGVPVGVGGRRSSFHRMLSSLRNRDAVSAVHPLPLVQAPLSRPPSGRFRFRELARFGPVIRDVQTTLYAFSQVLTQETQTKIEMKVRAESTKKFLATMSHEMRTPLNGIIGMLELALDCELPAEAEDFIRSALSSADHLLFLINDVLDYQRIEAGMLELQQVPFSVRDAFTSAARMVQMNAAAKGLEIELDMDANIPPLLVGDPDRLRQCLLNLLSNAVKYSWKGTIKALARVQGYLPTAEGGQGGGSVAIYFEVADKGPGIDPESMKQLFSRFFRVPTRGKEQPDPGGSGLGLAITKEIVERAGGKIGCHSEVGVGSSFFFHLPFTLPEEGDTEEDGTGTEDAGTRPASGPGSPAASFPRASRFGDPSLASSRSNRSDGQPRRSWRLSALGRPSLRLEASGRRGSREAGTQRRGSVEAPRTPTGGPGGTATAPRTPTGVGTPASTATATSANILVAEDDAVNSRILTTILRNAGHSVVLAENGAAAVEAFRTASAAAPAHAPCIDVIFMDCSMPVMDGYDATRAIRALEAERGLPRHAIVALTAHAGVEDEAACLRCGMDYVLTKPVRKGTLLAKVDELASALRGRTGAPMPPSALSEAVLATFGDASRPPSPPPRRPARGGLGSLEVGSGRASPSPSPPGPKPGSGSRPPSAPGSPPPAPAAPSPSSSPPPPPAPPPLALAPPVEPRRRKSITVTANPLSRLRYLDLDGKPGEGGAPSASSTPKRRQRRMSLDEGATAAAAALDSAAGSPASTARTSPTAVKGAPLDILVVDDVEMNRRVLCAFLSKEGHCVEIAKDGEEAVQAFEIRASAAAAAGLDRAPYSLVFMDVAMPKMDGKEAARRIRSLEAEMGIPKRTPIVACTAFNSPQDRDAVLQAGMDAHIAKPVTRAILLPVLKRFGGAGGGSPAGTPSGAATPPFASPAPSPLAPLAGRIGGVPGRSWSEPVDMAPAPPPARSPAGLEVPTSPSLGGLGLLATMAGGPGEPPAARLPPAAL